MWIEDYVEREGAEGGRQSDRCLRTRHTNEKSTLKKSVQARLEVRLLILLVYGSYKHAIVERITTLSG